MKKVEDAITYFEALLDRLGNGDSDNLVCATALEALREKRDRDVTGNNRINAEMNLQEMLTEKQLQALVDCGEKEDCAGETCPMFDICDNDYTNKVAAEAAKTAIAYREMLERLETVLKQARTALSSTLQYVDDEMSVHEILAAIDKIGGWEDV